MGKILLKDIYQWDLGTHQKVSKKKLNNLFQGLNLYLYVQRKFYFEIADLEDHIKIIELT